MRNFIQDIEFMKDATEVIKLCAFRIKDIENDSKDERLIATIHNIFEGVKMLEHILTPTYENMNCKHISLDNELKKELQQYGKSDI